MEQSEKPAGAIKRLIARFGYENLGTPFRRYLCVYAAFTVASLLSSSYFNVFLLRATGSSMALMFYNLLLGVVQPIVMLFAVQVLRRASINACQRVGLVLHASAYLILAAISATSEPVAYAISMLFAAGNGFYFTSYTPQLLSYTTERNRDAGFGVMGFLSNVGSLTLPLITGFFISSFGDLVGYRILFAVSALSLSLGIFFSFRLTPIESAARPPKGNMLRVAKRLFQNKSMLRMMIITGLNAIEVSGKAYYGSLIVYALLKKESVIGTVTTMGAIVTLFATLIYGRVIRAENRSKGMVIASFVSLGAIVLLYFMQSPVGYIIYVLLYAASHFFVSTPVVTAYMGVTQHDELLNKNGAEVHVLREFFYASGRALGLLPVLLLKDPVAAAVPMLIGIAVIQLFAALLMRGIKKDD